MLTDIYLKSPKFLQNILISAYGIKVYLGRFRGYIPEEYRALEYPFFAPGNTRFEVQKNRLKALMLHCKSNVPYYKDVLQNVDVDSISADNLSDYFPVLTKKDVLYNSEELVSVRDKKVSPDVKISTSGTSGTPLTIYATNESRRINYALFENFLIALGSSYRSKSTIMAGRKLYKGESTQPDRYDFFNRTQYLSVYNISRDTISSYIAALDKWKPEYIDSHPSALFEIQYLAREQEIKLTHKPKFIVTSSETLTASMKESIERFFGAKVYDHYGCAEMCVSAFSDGNQYYNDPAYSVIELVEKGENLYSLVVTGLANFAMPLIRYELGDAVLCKDRKIPYVFDAVDGRLDDIIVTPEGKLVGRISPVFKGVPGLEVAQVIQRSRDELLVKVVLKGDGNDFDEDYLVEKLKSSTSESMTVAVQYVLDIDKQKNGKFKTVISEVKEL